MIQYNIYRLYLVPYITIFYTYFLFMNSILLHTLRIRNNLLVRNRKSNPLCCFCWSCFFVCFLSFFPNCFSLSLGHAEIVKGRHLAVHASGPNRVGLGIKARRLTRQQLRVLTLTFLRGNYVAS